MLIFSCVNQLKQEEKHSEELDKEQIALTDMIVEERRRRGREIKGWHNFRH